MKFALEPGRSSHRLGHRHGAVGSEWPSAIPGPDEIPPLPTGAKIRVVGEVLVAYGRVRWVSRRTDFRSTLAELRRDAPTATGADPVAVRRRAQRLARAVSSTLALLPTDSRCLVRSLVLTSLLSSRGIDSVFVIGVTPKPEFRAHAWVEHAGIPLLATGPEFERLLEI